VVKQVADVEVDDVNVGLGVLLGVLIIGSEEESKVFGLSLDCLRVEDGGVRLVEFDHYLLRK